MTIGSIIYLVILLLFFIGTFIFFIIMDLKNHKKTKAREKEEK